MDNGPRPLDHLGGKGLQIQQGPQHPIQLAPPPQQQQQQHQQQQQQQQQRQHLPQQQHRRPQQHAHSLQHSEHTKSIQMDGSLQTPLHSLGGSANGNTRLHNTTHQTPTGQHPHVLQHAANHHPHNISHHVMQNSSNRRGGTGLTGGAWGTPSNRCLCEILGSQDQQSLCSLAEVRLGGKDHPMYGWMLSLPIDSKTKHGISRRKRWLIHLGITEEQVMTVGKPVVRWTHFPPVCWENALAASNTSRSQRKRRRLQPFVERQDNDDPADSVVVEGQVKTLSVPSEKFIDLRQELHRKTRGSQQHPQDAATALVGLSQTGDEDEEEDPSKGGQRLKRTASSISDSEKDMELQTLIAVMKQQHERRKQELKAQKALQEKERDEATKEREALMRRLRKEQERVKALEREVSNLRKSLDAVKKSPEMDINQEPLPFN